MEHDRLAPSLLGFCGIFFHPPKVLLLRPLASIFHILQVSACMSLTTTTPDYNHLLIHVSPILCWPQWGGGQGLCCPAVLCTVPGTR